MKLRNKFRNAFKGIGFLLINESNAWIHLFFTVIVITGGFYFNITSTEWLMILLCIGAVFTAEALNTAIERFCDLEHREENKQVRVIKDLSAGAVLIISIISAIIGVIVFLPYIIEIL
jgi:diacylglycerol kinase